MSDGTYVDDINSSFEDIQQLKSTVIDIFRDGEFELQKWHSNVAELKGKPTNTYEETCAKDTLETKQSEVKLLQL